MAHNPLRFAWGVIWLSMALFVALAAAGVLAGLRYVSTALEPASATLISTTGTVLVQEASWSLPGAVHVNQPLYTGDRIVTDSLATAQIRFADGSTISMQPSTELLLTTLRQNRYHWLSAPRRQVEVDLHAGKLEATVTGFPDNGSLFRITALGTEVTIPEGTSDVWLSQPRTAEATTATTAPFTNSCCAAQVLTQNGTALVRGSGPTAVTLQGDQRATVPMGGIPYPSPHASWDLLVNGSFTSQSNGLPDGWGSPGPTLDPPSLQLKDHVALIPGPVPALHLWSSGSNDTHRGIYFQQDINRDVRDVLRLDLVVNFRIDAQSLPGGGVQATEYPFRVTVEYVARSGGVTRWFHGWYIRPPEGNYIVDGNAEHVTPNQWISGPDGGEVLPISDMLAADPPVFIKWVQFSASGRDFDSEVREVRLLAQ